MGDDNEAVRLPKLMAWLALSARLPCYVCFACRYLFC